MAVTSCITITVSISYCVVVACLKVASADVFAPSLLVNTTYNPTYSDDLKLLGWNYINYTQGWPVLSHD